MRIGNYEVLEQIGEGGFARIFQARHVILEEKACLKQNINASPEDYQMLINEARMMWRLDDHHSIPSIKDFIRISENNGVMVMSFVDGQSIDKIISENSRLHPEDACWVTERILGALYYCHCYGVVHSDVKPPNIFIEPKKRDIKLIDFGLAANRPKSTTKPMGYTPLYAAPEIIAGKPPIPESDIYGAGLTMLYMLGGDVQKKSLPADVPKPIADYCNDLIKYDPTDRPNWDKRNPIETLSEIRQQVFGRKHIR